MHDSLQLHNIRVSELSGNLEAFTGTRHSLEAGDFGFSMSREIGRHRALGAKRCAIRVAKINAIPSRLRGPEEIGG